MCHTSGSIHVVRHEEPCPAAVQTTLYDLIETLQEIMGSEYEAQVVAIVVKMIQSGRIRAVRSAWRSR